MWVVWDWKLFTKECKLIVDEEKRTKLEQQHSYIFISSPSLPYDNSPHVAVMSSRSGQSIMTHRGNEPLSQPWCVSMRASRVATNQEPGVVRVVPSTHTVAAFLSTITSSGEPSVVKHCIPCSRSLPMSLLMPTLMSFMSFLSLITVMDRKDGRAHCPFSDLGTYLISRSAKGVS